MKTLTNTLLVGSLLFVSLAGCGNPSNCLSNELVQQMIASTGLSECPTPPPGEPAPDPCGLAGAGGSTDIIPHHEQPCAYKGNASCGTPDSNGCNMKADVQYDEKVSQCAAINDESNTWTVRCFTALTFNASNLPCNPTSTSAPQACQPEQSTVD